MLFHRKIPPLLASVDAKTRSLCERELRSAPQGESGLIRSAEHMQPEACFYVRLFSYAESILLSILQEPLSENSETARPFSQGVLSKRLALSIIRLISVMMSSATPTAFPTGFTCALAVDCRKERVHWRAHLASFLCGGMFAGGLVLSGMVQRAKVVNFLALRCKLVSQQS